MTTERWYFIRAYNTPTIHAYGTEADCDRYVDHLNERLTVNLFGAHEADEAEVLALDARAIRCDDAVNLRDAVEYLEEQEG